MQATAPWPSDLPKATFLTASPTDLTVSQRWALGGAAVAAHVAVGALILFSTPTVEMQAESSPITVDLIAPMQAPPAPPKPEPAPPKPKQIQPPEPVKPKPRVLSSHAPSENQIQAEPEPVKQPIVAAPPPAPVEAPPAPVAAAPAPATPPQPKQLAASAVAYLIQPAPKFPEASRRLGESGVVRLKVLVDESGRPVEIQVTQSSGYDRLDKAAVAAMKLARMKPYMEGGVPRAVWAPASLTFDLQD